MIRETLIYATISGGAGGFALFLLGLKRGRYRNNRYFSKFSIEILGAAITALFLVSIIVPENNYKMATAIAFAIGVAWAEILQTVRIKVTEIVEATLKNTRKKDKDDNNYKNRSNKGDK